MKMYFLLAALICSSNLGFASVAMADQAERTPFTDVQFDGSYVKVEVDGELLNLLSINGVKRADIMGQCEQTLGAACKCAFATQFTATMAKLQMPVEDQVNVSLYRFATHEVLNLTGLPVSNDNQQEILVKRELRNETCP